jgi:hypothetical protein
MSIAPARLVSPDAAGRRARAVVLVCAATAVLVPACSHAGHEPSTTPAVATPGASKDPGSGSAAHPLQIGCPTSGGGQATAPARPEDFGVGPLRYASAAAWATTPPPNDVKMPDGRYFYKTGAILRPGSVVTVTIAPAARHHAAIDVQGGTDAGSVSVTYHACPSAPDTGWPGGFLLTERTTCLPLDVRVLGEPRERHVVISVFHHSCRQ